MRWGFNRRSVEQVEFKWVKPATGGKKTFTEAHKYARKTDGGPPIKPPTAAEEKIIDLMNYRPNFSRMLRHLSHLCHPYQVQYIKF